MLKITFFIFFAFFSINGIGQDSLGRMINPDPGIKQPLPSDTSNIYMLTNKEAILSYAVLFCMLIIIFIEVWVIRILKMHEDNAIKLLTITLVLMGTLFLIMAGYDERVIAPVFGLFGTIVGYLFGKSSK